MIPANPKYPHIGRKEEEVGPSFWEKLYRTGETGWDQGGPSPALVDFLKTNRIPPGRVLVPGCGRGHDARALAKTGFGVTGIDAVEDAIRQAAKLAEAERLEQIEFIQADFFDLPASLRGPYDAIFEHTFFCAIDPGLRDRYVEIAADLLKPSGRLLGVFFNIQPETGPPFGATREELIERFAPQFNLIFDAVPRSLPNREGKELMMLWQRN